MPTRKLTDALIRAIPAPEEGRREHYDEIVPGLAVRVTSSGHKSFAYRYRFGDDVKRYTIGPFAKVPLAEARKKARELARTIGDGVDPMAEKKRARRPDKLTFGRLVDRYCDGHLPTLKDYTQYTYRKVIESELLPAFGKVPTEDLTREDVQSLLDRIGLDRKAKAQANRVRAVCSSILSYGVTRGLIESNVADMTARFRTGGGGRDRYYSEDEIRSLWAAFDSEEPTAGALLKTLLLTGQRKGETSRMKWADLRGDQTWRIPAVDAKANREHVVPLSTMALDVIESMRPLTGGSPYVFASPTKPEQPIRTELSRPVQRIREGSGVGDFRPHDLRRTFATYLAADGVDRTTLGRLLNHRGLEGGAAVTRIYDRHARLPEMRDAVKRWGESLIHTIDGAEFGS